MGGKVILVIEGNWEHLYDFLNELPKDFAICLLDEEDIFRAKTEIGGTVALAGGCNPSMLRFWTKEQCISHAGKLLDKVAPGGGFLFTSTTLLLAKNDVNPENMRAMNEYVHNMGR